MKKISLTAAFILGIAGFASAQTSGRSKNTHAVSNTKTKTTTTSKSTSTVIPADNRTEYVVNGQKATATGHEATAVNAQHASEKKVPPKRAKGKH